MTLLPRLYLALAVSVPIAFSAGAPPPVAFRYLFAVRRSATGLEVALEQANGDEPSAVAGRIFPPSRTRQGRGWKTEIMEGDHPVHLTQTKDLAARLEAAAR